MLTAGHVQGSRMGASVPQYSVGLLASQASCAHVPDVVSWTLEPTLTASTAITLAPALVDSVHPASPQVGAVHRSGRVIPDQCFEESIVGL